MHVNDFPNEILAAILSLSTATKSSAETAEESALQSFDQVPVQVLRHFPPTREMIIQRHILLDTRDFYTRYKSTNPQLGKHGISCSHNTGRSRGVYTLRQVCKQWNDILTSLVGVTWTTEMSYRVLAYMRGGPERYKAIALDLRRRLEKEPPIISGLVDLSIPLEQDAGVTGDMFQALRENASKWRKLRFQYGSLRPRAGDAHGSPEDDWDMVWKDGRVFGDGSSTPTKGYLNLKVLEIVSREQDIFSIPLKGLVAPNLSELIIDLYAWGQRPGSAESLLLEPNRNCLSVFENLVSFTWNVQDHPGQYLGYLRFLAQFLKSAPRLDYLRYMDESSRNRGVDISAIVASMATNTSGLSPFQHNHLRHVELYWHPGSQTFLANARLPRLKCLNLRYVKGHFDQVSESAFPPVAEVLESLAVGSSAAVEGAGMNPDEYGIEHLVLGSDIFYDARFGDLRDSLLLVRRTLKSLFVKIGSRDAHYQALFDDSRALLRSLGRKGTPFVSVFGENLVAFGLHIDTLCILGTSMQYTQKGQPSFDEFLRAPIQWGKPYFQELMDPDCCRAEKKAEGIELGGDIRRLLDGEWL